MSKNREFTLRINVTDHDKWTPFFKELMLHPKVAEEKYGFSVNASALGDLFIEGDIYQRALEKIQQDDLSKEDLVTKKDLEPDIDDEDWDPHFEDVQDLIDDAFKQAEHHRDKRNLEYGTQRELMLQFKKEKNEQNLSTRSGEGKENQDSQHHA